MQIQKTFFFSKNHLAQNCFASNLLLTSRFHTKEKLVLDLGHEKVVACDVTFQTKDKNIFSPISLQCLIFT